MPSSTAWISLVVFALCAALLAAVLIGGMRIPFSRDRALRRADEDDLRRVGVRLPARVTGIQRMPGGLGPRYVFQATAPDPADGRARQFLALGATRRWRVGDAVIVLLDPRDPGRYRITKAARGDGPDRRAG